MRPTLRLIDNLRKIIHGESIPYSSFPKSLAEPLVKEGLLNIEYHGSRRCLRTHNPTALKGALPRYDEAFSNLDAAILILSGNDSRAAQAALSGNSKIRRERSCPGFLVNSYCRIECLLNGKAFTINSTEGSALYIADWESFIPPTNALVIGIENMENFLKIRCQKQLFSTCLLPHETHILFVARYAYSSDLAQWLGHISNRYLHFGDFDLAGINIFLTEFLPFVDGRGSFLIPADIEYRLGHGSRHRYDKQYNTYQQLTATDPDLKSLIAMIHRYRRCYDQEGYISET